MLLSAIVLLTEASAVNGGATMISTSLHPATKGFSAVVSETASETVLFSFQFPAMIGVLILLTMGSWASLYFVSRWFTDNF